MRTFTRKSSIGGMCALTKVAKVSVTNKWFRRIMRRANPMGSAEKLVRRMEKAQTRLIKIVPSPQETFNFRVVLIVFSRETMALTIPLCIGLMYTSTVSTMHIHLPELMQQSSGAEPDSAVSNSTTNHARLLNGSLLSLPAGNPLNGGYNNNNSTSVSVSNLNLSTAPVFNCDEGWGRDLTTNVRRSAGIGSLGHWTRDDTG